MKFTEIETAVMLRVNYLWFLANIHLSCLHHFPDALLCLPHHRPINQSLQPLRLENFRDLITITILHFVIDQLELMLRKKITTTLSFNQLSLLLLSSSINYLCCDLMCEIFYVNSQGEKIWKERNLEKFRGHKNA